MKHKKKIEIFVPFSEIQQVSDAENDDKTSRCSPETLGDWGKENYIEPLYEALEEGNTNFHPLEIIAGLVFHARHLHPIEHANLARFLLGMTKPQSGRKTDFARQRFIYEAIENNTYKSPIIAHELRGLNRKDMIAAISVKFGMNHDAAEKAFDKEYAKVKASGRQLINFTESGPQSKSDREVQNSEDTPPIPLRRPGPKK